MKRIDDIIKIFKLILSGIVISVALIISLYVFV
jgi:hypothetical protein